MREDHAGFDTRLRAVEVALFGLVVLAATVCSADAQFRGGLNNRAIALGVAASGIYAAVGIEKECEGAGARWALDPRDGLCKSGWYNYELGNTDYLRVEGTPTKDKLGIVGGVVVAGTGAFFAARPAGANTEVVTYTLLGIGMIAGAFDYSCGGKKIAGECLNTNYRSSRFLEDASEAKLDRPSLLFGGIAVTGLAFARYLTSSVKVQVAPARVRVAVGW